MQATIDRKMSKDVTVSVQTRVLIDPYAECVRLWFPDAHVRLTLSLADLDGLRAAVLAQQKVPAEGRV